MGEIINLNRARKARAKAEEAERRWIEDPHTLLHPSEWTDGDSLWVLDFVAAPGLERGLLRHARDRLFADQASFTKAYRAEFGVTPGVHRRRPTV